MSKVILPRTNIVRSYNPSSAPAPRAPISMTPTPESLQAVPEHTERILLLEDEAQTNFILREYLGSLGYQVVAVANGLDGLKEVIKTDFELVICDMMMPKLPGDMFYLAVQKTRPQLCNRFVFITGHQQNPKIDAFIERTHSAILVKPFRLQQLEATLESILSRFPKKFRPVSQAQPMAGAETVERPLSNQPIALSSLPEAEKTPVVHLPAEKTGSSMVSKALKMVGFMRGNQQTAPVPAPTQKITRRIPADDTKKVTRRIAHLANAPVQPTPEGAITKISPATPRVTRRIAHSSVSVPPGSLSKPTPEPISARVTRRIAPPAVLPPTGSLGQPSKPVSTQVTRRIPAPSPEGALTKSSPRVTRRVSVPLETPNYSGISKKSDSKVPPQGALTAPKPITPKVTRVLPKGDNILRVKDIEAIQTAATKSRTVLRYSEPTPATKLTRKTSAPATTPAPKVTLLVAKTTRKTAAPKVTAKVSTPKASPVSKIKAASKIPAKVAAKAIPKTTRKVEKPAPAPVVTSRISGKK